MGEKGNFEQTKFQIFRAPMRSDPKFQTTCIEYLKVIIIDYLLKNK
jgi:hypothetical protein